AVGLAAPALPAPSLAPLLSGPRLSTHPAPPATYTLPLHDALPISRCHARMPPSARALSVPLPCPIERETTGNTGQPRSPGIRTAPDRLPRSGARSHCSQRGGGGI